MDILGLIITHRYTNHMHGLTYLHFEGLESLSQGDGL